MAGVNVILVVVVVVVVVAAAAAAAAAVILIIIGFFNNNCDKRIINKVSMQCINNNVSKKYYTSLHINIYHCIAYGTESFCA